MEAHTAHALPRLLAALDARGLRREQVRWIILTHAHLDHAAGAGALAAACPNATVAAHGRTAKHMIDPSKLVAGARAVYGERFDALYGPIEPIPQARVKSLADGESIELGGAKLTAWETFGHAFHHVVIHDPAIDTVYTGDTFGLVYPALQGHGRFAIPSTSPTGFDAEQALASLERVLALRCRFVCPTHFDAYEDAGAIAAQVRRFIERAAQWVDAGAKSGEDEASLARRFVDAWRAAIAQEAPRFGDAERALLELDVELNAQGLAYAALARRRS